MVFFVFLGLGFLWGFMGFAGETANGKRNLWYDKSMKFTSTYEPGEFETDIYAAWEASGAFRPRIIQYDSKEVHTDEAYSLVMPPPNANGDLHIGHGLTIALEDSLARYYRLRGKSTWYIPGADHAGFETWVVYEKELEKQGRSRFEFTRDELYAGVWRFVQEQRGNMEVQVRALGASASWQDLTFTLDENVIDLVYKTFEKMWQDGMIYRGEKLVNFCTKHQTAFADIEVVYKDEEGTLWEIAYPYEGGEIVVSTTRPETMLGDVAVAVNPKDKRYRSLLGRKVKLPLTDREIPVIADEYAEMDYGTGVVKITPAHDFGDFEVAERHQLPRIAVIGEDGKMNSAAGAEFEGMSVLECRKEVLKRLKKEGLLVGEKEIQHAVAHCYKCGTVIEPMLKEQWFIDVEKLAKLAIERLEKDEIKFFPESKKQVLINYLKGLKDWNISRQIPWGIAIPMFRKVVEDAPEAPDWIFDRRVNLPEIEVGGVRYQRDNDTFDTWFSSAHWPIVCTNWQESVENPYYPLNVMETGVDILFAWVARMIMMGVYVTGEVPFREVYLHGLVLDEHGKKMSKSKGNVINPMMLVAKHGSDAFRLGILRGRSAGMNQAFSEATVVAGRNLCNKLWNISRYVQGVVDGATAEDLEAEHETDNMGEDWICRELNRCRERIESSMKEYRFSEAVEVIYTTIWDKYADWFLESQKLHGNVALIRKTFKMLLVMLHPFAPFVTEAIWQNLSFTEGMLINEKWPEELEFDEISAENFEQLMAVVTGVRATLSAIPGNERWDVIYGNDSLVADNAELIIQLARVKVYSSEGQPRGIRLALPNREVYLDVPEEVVVSYKDALVERILAVGKELNLLNARMMNPRYVEKAPAKLVKETREQIEEKEMLIAKLKRELEVIK